MSNYRHPVSAVTTSILALSAIIHRRDDSRPWWLLRSSDTNAQLSTAGIWIFMFVSYSSIRLVFYWGIADNEFITTSRDQRSTLYRETNRHYFEIDRRWLALSISSLILVTRELASPKCIFRVRLSHARLFSISLLYFQLFELFDAYRSVLQLVPSPFTFGGRWLNRQFIFLDDARHCHYRASSHDYIHLNFKVRMSMI